MSAEFPTTHWSVLLTLKEGGDEEARLALARLCELYWPPLYTFVRRLGVEAEEARDVVQSYFAHLLEQDVLPDLDAARGRFRSFLVVSMRNFVHNWREHEKARKRRPEGALLAIDTGMLERELSAASGQASPEELYERRWAWTLIERAVTTLEAEESRSGRGDQFALLRGYVVGGESTVSYQEAAARLGVSVGALRVRVHRLRQRLGSVLRQQVLRTVSGPPEVESELRHLLSVVGDAAGAGG